ncbi:MAG: hypothetical protein WAN48_11425 [Actinomycetes bacterium]
MAVTITPEELYFGAPASLTFGGVECGATVDPPKFSLEVTTYVPEFQGARGPIKGTAITTKVIPSCSFVVNQITAQKLAWAMPGSVSTSSQSIGQVVAGYDTTLAADPALGATNIKVASVTTIAVGAFVRINTPGSPTEANSEVVRVLTVGTTGGGGTGLDIENDAGGGLRIDHANAEQVVAVTGTLLSAPAAAGSTNIKVDVVTGLIVGDYVRIGYATHYEIRQLTAVGTAGVGGTGLTFLVPLTRDHSLDEWCIEVTTAGGSTISWTPGRIGTADYKSLVLTGVGLDGRQMVVTLLNAMSAEPQELEFSDSNVSGLAVKFSGYYDPTTPTVAPFTIVLS